MISNAAWGRHSIGINVELNVNAHCLPVHRPKIVGIRQSVEGKVASRRLKESRCARIRNLNTVRKGTAATLLL